MIRNTRQRNAILKALELTGRPLSPVELHSLAKQHFPKLGLRTVYRNIRELVEEDKLAGIDYPGQPIRYELVNEKGSRPHFVCRNCHKLFELPFDEPSVPYPDLENFKIEGHEIVYYGSCKDPVCCSHNKAETPVEGGKKEKSRSSKSR